jgi:hypothetical protein
MVKPSDEIISAPIIIQPRILPRTLDDFVFSVLIASIQITCLFLIPAAITFFLSGLLWLAILVCTFVYLLFLLFSVWTMSLSSNGIKFKRLLGSPRFIAWKDVVAIDKVSRWELIYKGWLWPMFPAREMTASMSSLGHYRICWHGGFCYYPPKDCVTFERHVSWYLSQAQDLTM